MQWLSKIKAVKTRKTVIIALVLALALITVFTARCYSYLLSVRSAEIEVSTASQQNVLRLSGSFDLERWVSSNETGYYLTNLGDEDLWVYLEYTGELGQVFAAAVPVLVPRKGGDQPNTVSLKLAPLDDISAPRVLNPQDVFTSDDGSREFSGTIKIYTLNKYVALETDRIDVPGEALWQIMAARKFPALLSADTAKAMKTEPDADLGLNSEDEGLSDGRDLGVKALDTVADDEKYLALIKEHKKITLKDRVVFVVERVAPGLIGEHEFLTEATEGLIKRFDRLNQIVQRLVEDRNALQQTVNTQAETIKVLENENVFLTQQVKELQERLSALSAALSASTAGDHEVNSPAGSGEPTVTEETAPSTELTVNEQEQAAPEQDSPTLNAGADADVPAEPSAQD